MEFVQRWSIANGGHIQGIYLSWEINHSRETMGNSCLPSFTQNIHQQNIILKSAPSPPIVVNIKSLLVSHPFKGSHNAESSKVHHVAKQCSSTHLSPLLWQTPVAQPLRTGGGRKIGKTSHRHRGACSSITCSSHVLITTRWAPISEQFFKLDGQVRVVVEKR